jgi:hypothetical protein
MASQRGSFDLPRYWITLGKETIWDYPKDFKNRGYAFDGHQKKYRIVFEQDLYPYGTAISDISNVIREYIDTPRSELLVKSFENDR